MIPPGDARDIVNISHTNTPGLTTLPPFVFSKSTFNPGVNCPYEWTNNGIVYSICLQTDVYIDWIGLLQRLTNDSCKVTKYKVIQQVNNQFILPLEMLRITSVGQIITCQPKITRVDKDAFHVKFWVDLTEAVNSLQSVLSA